MPGKVEINISDYGSLSMKTLSTAGERIDYHLSKLEKSLTVRTENDIYFDKNNDLHCFYNIRAYSVVQNKEEFKRLVPYFWRIIQRIIGDDKILLLPDGWTKKN